MVSPPPSIFHIRFLVRVTWLAAWATPAVFVVVAALLWSLTPDPQPTAAQTGSEITSTRTGQKEDVPFEVGIGLSDARRWFGDALPTGQDVIMGHVEGSPDRYLPNRNDDRFEGVTLKARAGRSQTFDHTTHTAGIIYGPRGLAPGVPTVHHFSVRSWLGNGYLRVGESRPPRDEPPRIWSHSWISDRRPAANDKTPLAHVLRRVDDAIDRHGTIMCVGVNNGRASTVPVLLASAYNAIAVGATNGASSGRYTQFETVGRCKPDLIASKPRTSYSTPVVAACAARLLEMANRMNDRAPHASRPEVIKAALLAGAVKPWNWNPEPGKPLDEHLGAGRVHLGHALRIMEAGVQPPDETSSSRGWDYREIERKQHQSYHISVPDGAAGISVIVTWHRRINGQTAEHLLTGQDYWIDTPRLANLDLRVHYTSAGGETGVIGRSTSDIDNVEHVYIEQPPPGDYRVEVRRENDAHDESWTYAVAWRVVTDAEE